MFVLYPSLSPCVFFPSLLCGCCCCRCRRSSVTRWCTLGVCRCVCILRGTIPFFSPHFFRLFFRFVHSFIHPIIVCFVVLDGTCTNSHGNRFANISFRSHIVWETKQSGVSAFVVTDGRYKCLAPKWYEMISSEEHFNCAR